MFPELAPISFLLAAFVLFPLPWHWRSGNVAVLALNAWLFALNIIYGIDAVIWSDNVNITTWYWCDISMCSPPSFIHEAQLYSSHQVDYWCPACDPSSLFMYRHPPGTGCIC